MGQVLFFCVLMDRDEVEVHENAKKERGQYPAILAEQAWSIKDLLDMNMFETYFVLRLKYSVRMTIAVMYTT